MINLKLNKLYGMDNYADLMQAIKSCREMGMTDEEIQKVLDRSEEADNET